MKLERGTVKYLIFSVITTIIFCILLFPLLDWILSLIKGSSFEWNVRDHIIDPLIYGSIAAVVFWIFDKVRKKK